MGVYLSINNYSDMQGPAPAEFHVPSKDEWVALCGILNTTFSMAANATTMGTYLKMPLAGNRDYRNSDVNYVGSYGYYWSSTPYNADSVYALRFLSYDVSTQNYNGRAEGFAVRCFKNSPTVPTSSWTTLYDGSSVASGAGVFWNSTEGLISVSGNGHTWYTIMDKNLGATTVFNQGDTVSNANCGYFYQWGNNYGFAHSGTLTTSSTQVDASNYGPGNYYSSSTFITRTSSPYDRSSVQNDNLWGGVTGVVPVQKELKNAYIGIPFPTSIALNKSSIILTTVGQTVQLTATIKPTVSDKTITWNSDDTTVATVSTTGLVTCVTPGTCTITATTVNGLTASCSVDDQQGWQPGANTLCYYPFDTDYSDQSGNGYNLTNRGATTIGTKGGVDCAVFIKNSNSGLYSTSVPFSNISTTMTFSFWMYVDQFNTGENNVFGMGTASAGSCIILWYLQPINIGHRGYNDIATSTTSTLSTWQNIVVTQDSSGTKIYLDGNQIGSSSYYATLSGNQFNVGYFNGSSALNRKYIGGMSNLILESKTWTAQDVADYYNQTKSLYGIS